jgi:hypothetical protein
VCDVYNHLESIRLYDVWCDFLILKIPTIYLDRVRSTKKSDSTCKNTSIKHLKIEIEFFLVLCWSCGRGTVNSTAGVSYSPSGP